MPPLNQLGGSSKESPPENLGTQRMPKGRVKPHRIKTGNKERGRVARGRKWRPRKKVTEDQDHTQRGH